METQTLPTLQFKKLTLNDIPLVRPYLEQAKSRLCDSTVGGIFMWRDYFGTEYAICHDTVFFKVKYLHDTTAFTIPMGADALHCVEAILGYCRAERLPAVFCTVTERALRVMERHFTVKSAVTERDWFDYVYNSADLMTLAGKKYAGQRNHIHQFQRTYGNHEFVPVTAENIPLAVEFLHRFFGDDGDYDGTGLAEKKTVLELFDNYGAYGLLGGLLLADGKVIALSAGEVIGDTLFVHIEKADTSYHGAYQMMVNAFANYYGGGTAYINREEDVGDEGLRTSKLSYHPAFLLEKYTVEIGLN